MYFAGYMHVVTGYVYIMLLVATTEWVMNWRLKN